MLSQSIHNPTFLSSTSFWSLSKVYSAIAIFAISHAATCMNFPMSLYPHPDEEYSLDTDKNINQSTLDTKMTDQERNSYHKQPKINDDEDESHFFHPDTILFQPNDRKTNNFEIDMNATYISFNKSLDITAPKHPIDPIKLNPIKLPASNYQPKHVEHVLHKDLWPVDFESRKIFVRNKT